MNAKDFVSCKYDIHLIQKDQLCVDRYPDLGLFREIFMKKDLPKGLDPDFVLRFLILTYTPSSPFVKERTSDLPTRKTKVLEFLGITKQDQVTKKIEQLAMLSHIGIAHRWVTFLRIQANQDWIYLVQSQERYFNLIAEVNKLNTKGEGNVVDPLDEVRKTEAVSKLRHEITKSMNDFMAGERSKILEEIVSFSLMSDSFNIMPENYIRVWAETNKLPYDLSRTGL
jgi:hypothetical protein